LNAFQVTKPLQQKKRANALVGNNNKKCKV